MQETLTQVKTIDRGDANHRRADAANSCQLSAIGFVEEISSGGEADGTLIPTGSEPEWTDGRYGGALEFDGTNRVQLDGVQVNTTAEAQNTVSFWMCWDGTNLTIPFCWNGAYDLYLRNGYFGFNTGNSDLLGVEFSANDWAGKWVHVAAVFYNGTPSASTVELYINGVKQEISQAAGTPGSRSATTTAFLAGYYSTGYRFSGLIDDVRVYRGALSAAEIAAMAGTTYAYDAAGQLVSQTDPLGNTTGYDYDPLGRLVLVTDAESGETSYAYDAAGRRLSLTDPEGNTTTWEYDNLGRVIEETNELSETRSFVYNAAGLLVEKTDREGRVTTYEYDDLYRLKAENWLDQYEQTVYTISYTYDALGNLLTISDLYPSTPSYSSYSYTYEYDSLGRVVEETQTIAGLTPVVVFSSQYSAIGLRTQLSATIGGTADFVNSYTYDALGRLTQLTQDDQAGYAVAAKRIDLSYDAASRVETISRYANLAGTQEVATGTYTFDPLGRLTSLVYTQLNSTGLPYYGWTYDAAGNMTWMETIDGEVDYTHDDTNQLTDADYDYQTDENYTYDSNGNRTNTGYTTGPNNQLLTSSDGVTTYRYEYDGEGNRTLRYVDADSNVSLNSGDTDITEYEWDYRNRLTSVSHFDNFAHYTSETSDQIVEYTYDHANRLIKRVLDPDGTSGSTDVEQSVYVYEGNQIVAQFDKTGAGDLGSSHLSHRYTWNPQAVDQLFSDEQIHYDGGFVTDELLWALTDHLHSVRDLAVYNSGLDQTTVATHRVFDAFGNETSETSLSECLFVYTGKLFDNATQLQNNLNRWYDATVGRWLSEDSILDGTNLYRYVNNKPLLLFDPTGLCCVGECRISAASYKIKGVQLVVTTGAGDIEASFGEKNKDITDKLEELLTKLGG